MAVYTVRARFMSKTTNFNVEKSNLLTYVLWPILHGPGGREEDVEISERVTLNNATNESMFLALALAGVMTQSHPTTGLITAYMAARVCHNVSFLGMNLWGVMPRTVTYLTGLGITMTVAIQLLLQQ